MKDVLICDDDKLLCNLYEKALKIYGYNPVVTMDGAEGVDALMGSNNNFALAIIDLLMPVKSGFDMIKEMQSNPKTKDIPIIVITGLSESQEKFQEVKENCAAIMNKAEFNLSNFRNLVDEHILNL